MEDVTPPSHRGTVEALVSQSDSLEVATSRGPVVLGYTRTHSIVYLVARNREALWPVDLLRSGIVELSLDGSPIRGRVSLIFDAGERARVLDRFREKYGPTRYERSYAHPARVLRIDLSTAEQTIVPEDNYYRWLTDEFDNVAADYDQHILGNRINRLLRDRSLTLFRSTFSGVRYLLEIGCGSGMETLPLLRDGHEICAVDISGEMLETVRRKAAQEGLLERLRTYRLPARDLPLLLRDIGSGAFDGGYSTYGALNCEPELKSLPPILYKLIRPNGRLIAGVYNRWCAFEIVGYFLTGRFRRAFGRTAHPVLVGASRFCVDVFAYSVGEIERVFAPNFVTERVHGVPVFLPPSDLAKYAEKLSSRFQTLERWDAWFGRRFPFSYLGDHFLLVFRRAQ